MMDPLESKLADLALRPPGPSLDRRVLRELQTRTAGRGVLASLATLGAAAACLAIGIGVYQFTLQDSTAAAKPAVHHSLASTDSQPIRIDEVYSRLVPGELLWTNDETPVRPVQVQQVRHTQWIDESENYRIELTVPEQQTVLVDAPVR